MVRTRHYEESRTLYEKYIENFRESPTAMRILLHYGPNEIDYAIAHLGKMDDRGLLPWQELSQKRA